MVKINQKIYSTALEMHVAVAVLRLPEGLDYTGIIGNFIDETLKLKNDTGIDNPVFNKLKGDIPVEQSSLGKSFFPYVSLISLE